MSANRPKRVLIAQLSTIPHYRVRFYELLEQRRPSHWHFDVVFDCRESDNPRIYPERVDYRSFRFPILDTPTTMFRLAGKRVLWQHFLLKARHYDVIITDTHMADIAYPLSTLYRLLGKKHIFWGHLRNMNEERLGAVRGLGQKLKLWLVKHSDMFFAYTQQMSREAVQAGVAPEKVVALDNSIDTVAERQAYLELRSQRQTLREEFGVADKRVLLYVGRLIPDKRIDFLVEAFASLYRTDPRYHLFVVGGGPLEPLVRRCEQELGKGAITVFGPVSKRERLAPIYCASDLYFLPGAVGLAPLQALCYDLPAVVFELATHGPEFSYLNSENAVVLSSSTTAAQFAQELPSIFERFAAPEARKRLYETIEHLTLENMVEHFIQGVNAVCGA